MVNLENPFRAIPNFSDLALPSLCLLFLVTLFYAAVHSISNRQYVTAVGVAKFFGEYFTLLIPLCLAGTTSGYIAGVSRVPAVTSLLPASLSFVSAIILLVYAAKDRQQSAKISSCVVIFCLSLFSGTMIGADSRESGRVDRLKTISEQELQIRRYRKNRDLDPEFPAWLLTGEGIYK